MNRRIASALGGLFVGAGAAALAAPSSPVAALAGRYDQRFLNGAVDGSSYYSDDVAEVVSVDTTHAYVRFALNFYNGHTCSLSGVAELQGDALSYQAPPEPWDNGKPCKLTVRQAGARLVWNDGDNSCKAYCGMRGSFLGGSLPWASRRPITYLPRLKASRQYRQALTEWRTGHAVP